MSEVVVSVAKAEAEKVLEEEVSAEPEEALIKVGASFKSRAHDIDRIKHVADDKIHSVVQKHDLAQKSNDRVEHDLISDIKAVAEHGGDLDGLIEDAHLPFQVEVPHP